jgi:hypothetical protein
MNEGHVKNIFVDDLNFGAIKSSIRPHFETRGEAERASLATSRGRAGFHRTGGRQLW